MMKDKLKVVLWTLKGNYSDVNEEKRRTNGALYRKESPGGGGVHWESRRCLVIEQLLLLLCQVNFDIAHRLKRDIKYFFF